MSGIGRFVWNTLAGFRANQGFLLASAVAYNTLLSLVPMLALMLLGLSAFVDRALLIDTMATYVSLIAPLQTEALVEQVSAFLDNWKLIGGIGLLALVFFSSLAFTVLENAMSVIFFHRVAIRRRHFLVSAILPYAYILLLALGLLVVAAVSGALQTVDQQALRLFGRTWSLAGYQTGVLYVLGVAGEVLLLTSLYLVMPVGRLAFRHALLGGLTAALLWELTRHLLVWYFSALSLVNIVYGSFATVIIVLISLEAGAIILLLGAQVIAEYERRGEGVAALTTGPSQSNDNPRNAP